MTTKMKDRPVRTVWLADLHVGSEWALANPAETRKNSPGKQVQAALYKAWCEAAKGPWHAPDALVINGDAIDGQGRKSAGTDQWVTDVDEQVAHCAELIAMWKAKQVYILGGSKYHVMVQDSGLSAEEMLGRRLGAVVYPNQEHLAEDRRACSGPHWFITFGGVTAHFAHHVSVSRVFHYKSTPIAREMMQAKLNDPMRREWDRLYQRHSKRSVLEDLRASLSQYQTKIVVRAHAHYFWACDAGGTLGITLPAWKVPDPWIIERDPLGFGHLGFVAATFLGQEYTWEKHLLKIEDVSKPPHSSVLL